jgi:hypothetical protein
MDKGGFCETKRGRPELFRMWLADIYGVNFCPWIFQVVRNKKKSEKLNRTSHTDGKDKNYNRKIF